MRREVLGLLEHLVPGDGTPNEAPGDNQVAQSLASREVIGGDEYSHIVLNVGSIVFYRHLWLLVADERTCGRWSWIPSPASLTGLRGFHPRNFLDASFAGG